MNDARRKQPEETWGVRLSFAVPNLARFRVNVSSRTRRGRGVLHHSEQAKTWTLIEPNRPKILPGR